MLTKSHIRKIAIEILTYRGCEVWSQNNARVVRGRTFTGRKGVADIIGWNKEGLWIAAEVKTRNDKLSIEQKDWLSKLSNAGGIALVAYENKYGQVTLDPYHTYVAQGGK